VSRVMCSPCEGLELRNGGVRAAAARDHAARAGARRGGVRGAAGRRLPVLQGAVRAALARLRAEGLVVAEPRRGHVIAPLTMRDVLEIYDLRLALEPVAAEAAAGAIDERELARLRALADPEFDVDDERAVERFLA